MEPDPWGLFALDPRDPANARLRASDSDRDVVRGLLAAAYADGRLDREEFDERSDTVTSARLLGDLPPIVTDLVPTTSAPSAGKALSHARPGDLVAEARRRYESDRRDALLGFVGPSLICLVIWAVVMFGEFFWPAFVIAGTGINLVQTLVRRQDIIEGHVRRLEKKQSKQARQSGQLEAKPPADDPEELA